MEIRLKAHRNRATLGTNVRIAIEINFCEYARMIWLFGA